MREYEWLQMPVRCLVLMCLFLCLSLGVWGQERCVLQGQTLDLPVLKEGGKDFFALDDPAVQKLVSLTQARLQVSTSGKTLYAFLPGRETYWNDGSGVFTRNGQELEAPGVFLAQPPRMERAALFEALGLKATPSSQGLWLNSLVTEITTAQPDSLEMRVQTSVQLKYVASEPEPGVVRLELPGAAWDQPERQFHLGDADVEVLGGERPDLPLVLQFRFLPFWAARVKYGLTREILITPEARQFSPSGQAAALVNATEARLGEGGRELALWLDRPVQFFWSQQGRRLILEFPGVTSPLGGVKVFKVGDLPVTRCEVNLQEGEGFEFTQKSDQPTVLLVRLAAVSTLKPTDPSGTALMNGFIGGRGSIVIDPGHGGGDPGCCNRGLGVWEKDVTLDICLRMEQILRAQGWQVEMTRRTDRDVTYAGSPDMMELQARADVANRAGADLFVSVHCNASVSQASRGSAIYWYKPEDRLLAEYLDVLDGSLGFEQDGLIQNSFAVLRLTEMPAVLVETAFLTNPVEGELLADPRIRQGIAERLAQGLGRYMAQGGSGRGGRGGRR